jgi:glutathione S-transferase
VRTLAPQSPHQSTEHTNMSSKLKLYYFSGKGRGEVTRLMLAESKTPFEDMRIKGEDWMKHKPEMPFGQMPVLEIDGWKLAESGAIERYVARKTNLYGSTIMEQAAIDMVVEGCNDCSATWGQIHFSKAADAKEKMATYLKDEAPRWAGLLNGILKKNDSGKGFMVGKTLTYADIAVYRHFSFLNGLNPDVLKNAPELSALCDRVAARPNIAEYVKNRPASDY